MPIDDPRYNIRRSLNQLRRDLEEYQQERDGAEDGCFRTTRRILDLRIKAREMGIDLGD